MTLDLQAYVLDGRPRASTSPAIGRTVHTTDTWLTLRYIIEAIECSGLPGRLVELA